MPLCLQKQVGVLYGSPSGYIISFNLFSLCVQGGDVNYRFCRRINSNKMVLVSSGQKQLRNEG